MKYDFPFYNSKPLDIGGWQWGMLIASVALGVACLLVPVGLVDGQISALIRVLLFLIIPLAALRLVAGPYWILLFRPLCRGDFGWMFFFAILNLIVSGLVGLLVMTVFGADENAALHGLTDMAANERVMFFVRSLPQLLGEELLTVIPFLAIMYLSYTKLKMNRGVSLFFAWFLSAMVFGLIHLPTYNWNWLQCLVVIGSARLVLTLAYIKTKNLWVSAGAHIINDWLIFIIAISAATQI